MTRTNVVTPGGIKPGDLEPYRRELTGYCYRMLGSGFEAEDAVQETMLRGWRSSGQFEGRSSLRSWLYSIATNVCIDMLKGSQRRAQPMEIAPSSPPKKSSLAAVLPENSWVSPIADERIIPEGSDPAEIAVFRDTIRLAFVTALQHLPPRQRAVLILCEVLRWHAAEVAQLLGTSVAAVNSALQRARATLAAIPASERPDAVPAGQAELLARYVAAFENYDVSALVGLLHEDAVQMMPPYAMWLEGPANIGQWMLGPGSGCRGSRLMPTAANGCPAFGQYRCDPDGGHKPWALQVLEISGGRITAINSFLETETIFPAFGLLRPPPRLTRAIGPAVRQTRVW